MNTKAIGTSHAAQMKSKGGPARVLNALRYSMQGFAAAWRDEHAFRQELMVVVPLIAAALVLPVTPTQKALLIGSVTLIIIVELMNSALEAAVDLVTLERNAMAQKAKDIASAAVFLCFANAAAVWAFVLFERFVH